MSASMLGEMDSALPTISLSNLLIAFAPSLLLLAIMLVLGHIDKTHNTWMPIAVGLAIAFMWLEGYWEGQRDR